MHADFQEKQTTLLFSTQICPKMNFGVGISKIQLRIRNLYFQDTMCVNFQLKRITLTFLAQICPKRKLGSEIQKTNVGIRISIFEIPCVPIFRQNGQLWLFGPKFAQGFWGQNFKNLSLDWESASLRYHVYQFSDIRDNSKVLDPNLPKFAPIFRQNEQHWTFGPKFAQKWLLGSEF